VASQGRMVVTIHGAEFPARLEAHRILGRPERGTFIGTLVRLENCGGAGDGAGSRKTCPEALPGQGSPNGRGGAVRTLTVKACTDCAVSALSAPESLPKRRRRRSSCFATMRLRAARWGRA
jgi:hypothetical protein